MPAWTMMCNPLVSVFGFRLPYFVSAGVSMDPKTDKFLTATQLFAGYVHLLLWIYVFSAELMYLVDRTYVDTEWKTGGNLNQLQSVSFISSTVAFGTIVVALVIHVIVRACDQELGYDSEKTNVLPPLVPAIIKAFLGLSILINVLLFIYVAVDVDRMLHFIEYGPGSTYTNADVDFTHDDKLGIIAMIMCKILILAIFSENQYFHHQSVYSSVDCH